jgi:predicted AAA+ superfamily ATPase
MNNIIENDAKRVYQNGFNKTKLEKAIRSLSRNICTQVKLSTLSQDIKSYEDEIVSDDTISTYIDILNKLYIVSDIQS